MPLRRCFVRKNHETGSAATRLNPDRSAINAPVNESWAIEAVDTRNALETSRGINDVPVIRNPLVGLAPYLGKFRAWSQIREFHCHSFFSELRPLPVVVQ